MTQPTSRPHLLLVEDNPGDVRLVREALDEGRLRPHLHVVHTCDDALAFLGRRDTFADAPRPDLVLLDLNLAGPGGLDVLERIRADEDLAQLPVCVLSSSTDPEDVGAAYDAHANAYITKPIDLDDFFEVVRSIERFWFATAALPTPARHAPPERAAAAGRDATPDRVATDDGPVHMLVIEDNPGDVGLVREALRGEVAYEMATATRLSEGLRRTAEGRPDLILLDLSLPDSRGLPTFRAVRDAVADAPVVILTATDDEELAVRAVAEGAQDYLVKDDLPNGALPRALRYAIERHRRLQGLQALTRDLQAFVAHAAHDLRTPIATMAGLAETLDTRGGELDDEQVTTVLRAVRRQAGRVSALINDMLDLARVTATLELEPVAVRRVVDHALRDAPPPTHVTVQLDLGPLPPVSATPSPLERVIVNLLTNAYHHARTTVAVSGRHDGDVVRLAVADDGSGVPEDLAERLFEPFTRGADRAAEGTGLGLAIVQQVVRGFGGQVTHDRDPRLGGARFEVSLPVWSADA